MIYLKIQVYCNNDISIRSMRVLILSQGYPSQKNAYSMAYVHARVKYYMKNNILADVLCFGADEDYEYDGIKIFCHRDPSGYDIVISHAPNLRNHLRFLFLNARNIKKILLVFHGHECLSINKAYPRPYSFMSPVKNWLWYAFYDPIKLLCLRKFISALNTKIHMIFVSENLHRDFVKYTKAYGKYAIIPNPVGPAFIGKRHDKTMAKFDFICIRPMDKSKYAVDLLCKIAFANPGSSFHLYSGQGKYFQYHEKPGNLEVINSFIKNDDLPELLSKYRAAIMLSRADSQGVMMCEMASIGMPVVVSDISVAREVLSGFDNVVFVDNENPIIDVDMIFSLTEAKIPKRYFDAIQNEIEYLWSINRL